MYILSVFSYSLFYLSWFLCFDVQLKICAHGPHNVCLPHVTPTMLLSSTKGSVFTVHTLSFLSFFTVFYLFLVIIFTCPGVQKCGHGPHNVCFTLLSSTKGSVFTVHTLNFPSFSLHFTFSWLLYVRVQECGNMLMGLTMSAYHVSHQSCYFHS